MSNPNLSNPEKLVNEARLNEYHQTILPYLGGHIECGFTPVGAIIAVMSNHAPANYLICNGRTVNIADYPELANHFLQEFGSKNYFGGNGTTTFAVPDLRGEFLRGTGTNGHGGEGSGANVGVHQNGTSIPNIAPWSSTTSNYVIQGFTNANGNSYGIENSDGTVHGVTAHRSVFNTSSRDTNGSGQGLSLKLRPTNTSVLYCIAFKNIYLNPSLDYSTDEKVVGTWIDGKPLYQKTISCGALPNNTSKDVAIGISNIDKVVSLNGIAIHSSADVSIVLNDISTNNNVNEYIRVVRFSENIKITSNSDKSVYNAYVTIQYTKTTD